MANEIAVVLRVQDDGSVVLARAARTAKDTGDAMERQLKPGVDRAEASLKHLGQTAGALPGPMGAVARSVSSLTSMLAGPAGLALGAVAVAGAMVKLASDLGGAIERLDNLKVQTGLGIAALQTFEQIAKEAGESPEGLVRSLGRVNEAIAEVLKGNTAAAKSFNAVGVDLVALVKSGASVEQVLEATARALVAIKDPTVQAARAQDLFGSRSAAIIAVLQRVGTDGLAPLIAEMRKAGIVTSDVTNAMGRAVDALQDQWSRRFTAMTNSVGSFAAAILLHVTGQIGPALDEIKKRAEAAAGAMTKLDAEAAARLRERFVALHQELAQLGGLSTALRIDALVADLEKLQRVQLPQFGEAGAARIAAVVKELASLGGPEAAAKIRELVPQLEALQKVLGAAGAAGPRVIPPDDAAVKAAGQAAQQLIDHWRKIGAEWVATLIKMERQADFDALRERMKPFVEDLRHLGELIKIQGSDWATGFGQASEAMIPMMRDLHDLEQAVVMIQTRTSFGGGWEPVRLEPETVRRLAEARQQISLFPEALDEAVDATKALDHGLLVLGRGSLPRVREELTLVTEETAAWDAMIAHTNFLLREMEDLEGPANLTRGFQQAARELTDFEREMARTIGDLRESQTQAYKDFFRDILSGTRSLEDAFSDLGQKLRASVAQFLSSSIVDEFRAFFAVQPGQSAAVLTGAHGLLAEFAQRFSKEGATLVSAFQGLSDTSLATAQAMAGAAGVMIGTFAGNAVFGGPRGPGQGQQIGSAAGGAIGLAVGAYFGGPFGAAAGGAIGSFAGGALGSLFDSDDVDAFGKALRDATSNAFKQGVAEAVQSGDVEAAWNNIEKAIHNAVLDAIVSAFVSSTVIRDAINPLVNALNDAFRQATGAGGIFDPEAFNEAFGPALDLFREKMAILRPVFEHFVDIFRDQIRPAVEQTATSTERIATATARAAGNAQEFARAVGDIPTEITVQVQRTDAPGRQHGGFVHGPTLGRDHVMAALDGGEFVVNARAARRFAPLLELINAGGTTRAGAMGFQSGGAVPPPAAGFVGRTQGQIDFVQSWLDGLRRIAVEFALLARSAEGLAAASALARGSMQIFDVQIGALHQQLAGATDPEEQVKLAQQLQAAIMGRYEMERALVQQEFAFRRSELQKTADLRLRALDQERQALQAQLQTAQEWARVVESVEAQIFQLFQQVGPTNPSAQFGEAFERFQAALGAFRADPTAEGAAEVQRFAQAALQAAQGVYTRPSPAFQALFHEITAALAEVAAIAQDQAGATSLADLQSALTTVDETIRAEQESLRTTLEALDAAQAAREIPILTAQGVALATIHTDLVALLQMLGVGGGGAGGGAGAGGGGGGTPDAAQQLREAFRTIGGSAEASHFAAKAFAAAGLPAWTLDQAQAFVGGAPLDAALAERYLHALIKAGLIPSFAHGGTMPRTGLALVHAGERITPAGGPMTINITVQAARDPEATARAVARQVAQVLRSPGPAREAVKAIRS